MSHEWAEDGPSRASKAGVCGGILSNSRTWPGPSSKLTGTGPGMQPRCGEPDARLCPLDSLGAISRAVQSGKQRRTEAPGTPGKNRRQAAPGQAICARTSKPGRVLGVTRCGCQTPPQCPQLGRLRPVHTHSPGHPQCSPMRALDPACTALSLGLMKTAPWPTQPAHHTAGVHSS